MSDEKRLEERLTSWAAVPDDADWNDVTRRAEMSLPAPRFTRRRLAVVLAAAAVVAGSLAVFLPGHSTRSSAPPGPHRPTGPSGPIGPGGDPGGHIGHYTPPRKITIAELRAEAPYIPLPDSELANDSNAGDVFVTPGVWPWSTSELSADVNYPTSGLELRWTDPGMGNPYPLRINGVPAAFWPGSGRRGSLVLDVLPTRLLALTSRSSRGLPESELIDVAKTLTTDTSSPGSPLPPADPSTPPGDTFNGAVASWWEPGVLLDAVPADSVDAAAGSLAFQPVAPPALGNPTSILQTDPSSAPPSDRVLSLRYDDPSMGRFWLLERPSGSVTTSLLRAGVSVCSRGEPECQQTASTVDLGGVTGLSMLDGVNDRIMMNDRIVWVEHGIYFEVIGPATFSPADALSVAKTVAAAAAG
jgi:hypothetical protein